MDNSLSKADSINNVITWRDFHVKRWTRYLFSYKQDIKEYHLQVYIQNITFKFRTFLSLEFFVDRIALTLRFKVMHHRR